MQSTLVSHLKTISRRQLGNRTSPTSSVKRVHSKDENDVEKYVNEQRSASGVMIVSVLTDEAKICEGHTLSGRPGTLCSWVTVQC